MDDVIIRDYRPEDFEEIKRIHEQGGLDYKTPDVGSPLFIVKKVMEVHGRVVCAALFRVEVETYLLLDKESGLDPEQNMAVLRALQAESMNALWLQGVDNAVCWVPEDVEKYFAKRLIELGWTPDRSGWHSWTRMTETK